MYKKTPPQQNLFGVDKQLSPSLRNRLTSSWAHLFRIEVLPILFKNEDEYAMLYGNTGRPNFSVARILGLCLLQVCKIGYVPQNINSDFIRSDIGWLGQFLSPFSPNIQ